MESEKFSASLLKALAHPTRLGILNVLRDDGECCVCHLESRLGLRQAYLSQQLARLREAGLVEDRREGLNVFYDIAHPELDPLLDTIERSAMAVAMRSAVELSPEGPATIPNEPCPCPRCQREDTLQTAESVAGSGH